MCVLIARPIVFLFFFFFCFAEKQQVPVGALAL